FWPGNALAIRSTETVPADAWAQVAVSYNGSGTAEGMRLFINGKLAGCEVIRNNLYKSPESSGSGFSFGALFRSTGLKGGLLDDLRVYNRPLAPIEVTQLFDGHSLSDALAKKDADALRPYYLAAVATPMAQARAELAA